MLKKFINNTAKLIKQEFVDEFEIESRKELEKSASNEVDLLKNSTKEFLKDSKVDKMIFQKL